MDDVTSAVDSADATRQQHQPDQHQDQQPARAARGRRVWLVVALGLVLAGAFTVSATSTWLLGDHHHLDRLARTALILMLEVGSVTGASIYVITRQTGTRTRAGLVVAIATGVGATGGVQAYGFLIGLPVAALLLLLVDLIAKFWHESTATAATAASPADSAEVAPVAPSVGVLSQIGAWWTALGPVEVVTTTATSTDSASTSTDSAPTSPDSDPILVGALDGDPAWLDAAPPEPLPQVRGVDPAVVAQVAAFLERERLAGRAVGRPRIRDDFELTDWRAGKVLDALRPLHAVRGEAS